MSSVATTDCATVIARWEESEILKAAGRSRYRAMNIDKWQAKWGPRYRECIDAQSAGEAISEALDESQQVVDQSNALTTQLFNQLDTTTKQLAVGLLVASVLILVVAIAGRAYLVSGGFGGLRR